MGSKMYGSGRISERPNKKIWIFQTEEEARQIDDLGGVAVVPVAPEHFAELDGRDVIIWAINNPDGVQFRINAARGALLHAAKVQTVLPQACGIKANETIIQWIQKQKNPRSAFKSLEIITIEPFMVSEDIKPKSIQPRKLDFDPDWESHLSLTEKTEKIRVNVANMQLIFGNHPLWRGVLGYNERTLTETIMKTPPWDVDAETPCQLIDRHASEACLWLSKTYDISCTSNLVHEGMSVIAQRNGFDPVRDYFDSLEWDGITRLHTWLHKYAGAPLTPYTQAAGTKYLISAVARTYRPGCQVDTMLILEGDQGLRKSTLFRALAGDEYFNDQVGALDSKDTLLNLHGPTIVEFADLDVMTKSEINKVKSFLTARIDKFRPPYGRTPISYPRRCVFAGTTNEDNYLKDATGGRRFWPIRVNKIDIESVQADRDQLWAEAVVRFREGETWHMNGELDSLARIEQADRYQSDPWEDVIEEYLLDSIIDMNRHDGAYNRETGCRVYVTTQELLEKAVQVPTDRRRHHDLIRCGNVMTRKMGWERRKIRENYRTFNVYIQPDDFGPDQKNEPVQSELSGW